MEKPLIVKAPSPGYPLGRNYCGNCQAEIVTRPPQICPACGCEVSGWKESLEADWKKQKITRRDARGLFPHWGYDRLDDENDEVLM